MSVEAAFWFGLAIFLLPGALLGWSVLTRRGRAAHAKAVARAQRDAEGLPPPPPRTPIGRWAAGHPRLAVAAGLAATVAVTFVLKTLVLDDSAGEALATGVVFGLEWLLIHSIVARRDRRPGARPSERPGR